jgi:hypothetical protein
MNTIQRYIPVIFILTVFAFKNPKNKSQKSTVKETSLVKEDTIIPVSCSFTDKHFEYRLVGRRRIGGPKQIDTIHIYTKKDIKLLQTIIPDENDLNPLDDSCGSFTLADMNRDGYNDFLLIEGYTANLIPSRIGWLYHPEKGRFMPYPPIKELLGLAFDTKTGTFQCDWHTGSYSQGHEQYIIDSKDSLVLIYEMQYGESPDGTQNSLSIRRRYKGRYIEKEIENLKKPPALADSAWLQPPYNL